MFNIGWAASTASSYHPFKIWFLWPTEAIVKIVGLRYHYFTVPWNVFDFLLVFASIFGILMEDVMIDLPISPTLLRVVRVFRIGRILRLIKAAKGIRKLLFALVVSLPALFNIGALLALITFIYAILGMSLFGHVRLQGALNDMVNFQTFGRSMSLLFRLMTSAGWNDVLEALMIQPPNCDPYFNHQANGDCGHPLLAITYFTSFIIINYMIVINMYIAIILENFNQAHQEEEIGIVEDDLEMFYIRWSKYVLKSKSKSKSKCVKDVSNSTIIFPPGTIRMQHNSFIFRKCLIFWHH